MVTEKTELACKFAEDAHKGQKRRKSNEGYVTHPLAVYQILKNLTKDENILCAALLHDVIEDTNISYEDIKNQFGEKVADLVIEVSKDSSGNYPLKTKEGLMIKLADTLHNISDKPTEAYVKKKIKFITGEK